MSESKPDIDAGAEAEPPRPEPAGEEYRIDTTYLRSLEGIFRIIELVVVIIPFILTIVAFLSGPGGWFFFVSISYVIYIVIVIVIEVFVPGIYVHRLIDGLVCIGYAILWGVAAIVHTVSAAQFSNGVLGAAAVSTLVYMLRFSGHSLTACV